LGEREKKGDLGTLREEEGGPEGGGFSPDGKARRGKGTGLKGKDAGRNRVKKMKGLGGGEKKRPYKLRKNRVREKNKRGVILTSKKYRAEAAGGLGAMGVNEKKKRKKKIFEQ